MGVYIHYSGLGHHHIQNEHLDFLIALRKNDGVTGGRCDRAG